MPSKFDGRSSDKTCLPNFMLVSVAKMVKWRMMKTYMVWVICKAYQSIFKNILIQQTPLTTQCKRGIVSIQYLPEKEQAHLRLQVTPWSIEGETSSIKELNVVLLCKFSLRLNKLKCCYQIPCHAASSQPMLTGKTSCKDGDYWQNQITGMKTNMVI